MKNINMPKARQHIRLDDNPESPVFTLDLTTSHINDMALPLAGSYAIFDNLLKQLNDTQPRSHEETLKLAERVASLYKLIIDTLLGEGAYQAVVDYACDGEDIPAYELTTILSPLVKYLFGQFGAAIGANMDEAEAKYLDADDGADAL